MTRRVYSRGYSPWDVILPADNSEGSSPRGRATTTFYMRQPHLGMRGQGTAEGTRLELGLPTGALKPPQALWEQSPQGRGRSFYRVSMRSQGLGAHAKLQRSTTPGAHARENTQQVRSQGQAWVPGKDQQQKQSPFWALSFARDWSQQQVYPEEGPQRQGAGQAGETPFWETALVPAPWPMFLLLVSKGLLLASKLSNAFSDSCISQIMWFPTRGSTCEPDDFTAQISFCPTATVAEKNSIPTDNSLNSHCVWNELWNKKRKSGYSL